MSQLNAALSILLLAVLAACGGGGGSGTAPGGAVPPVQSSPTTKPTSTPGVAPNYGYVTNFGDGTVTVFDPKTNAVVTTLSGFAAPMMAAANINTPYVYVSDFGTAQVYAIDSRTNAITTVEGGCSPWDVSMRPAGTTAYIGAQCSDTLDMLNTATNADSRATIPPYPYFTTSATVFANPALPLIYLASNAQSDNVVYVYDETKDQIVSSFAVHGTAFSYAANPSGSDLFVGTISGYVEEVNTSTNQLVASLRIGSGFITGLALNPSTNLLYAADSAGNRIVVIDASTMATVGSIPVGTDPTSVTLNAAGTTGYATDDTDGTVSVFDLKSAAVTATIKVGLRPRTVVIRDSGSAGAASCSGKPTAVRMVPDTSAHFVTSLAKGYRLVGPQAQQFDLTALDCNGLPVSGASFSTSGGAGLTVTPPSGTTMSIAAAQPLSSPTGLTVTATTSQGSAQTSFTIDASSAIYTVQAGGQVAVFDTHGNALHLAQASFAGIAGGGGMAYNPSDGHLYVTQDVGTYAVLAFDLSGNLLSTLQSAQLNQPTGIAFGSNGIFYVANPAWGSSPHSGSVIAMNTSGAVVSAPGAFNGLPQPVYVAFDPVSQHILVTDRVNGTLQAYDTSGNTIGSVSLGFSPSGVAVDPDTDITYVPNMNANSVMTFNSGLTASSTLSMSVFSEPYIAAFDSFDRLMYITNYSGGTGIVAIDEGGNPVSFAPEGNFTAAPADIQGIAVVP